MKNYESCVMRKKKEGRRMERFIYMAKGANGGTTRNDDACAVSA
jgi:hypothetical protein